MKKIYTYISLFLILIVSSFALNSCTEGFEEMNTSPRSIATVTPEQLLTQSQRMWMQGFPWNRISDKYFPWMQYGSSVFGNTTFASMITKYSYTPGIGGEQYGTFNRMGSYVTHIEYLAEKDGTGAYSNVAQMARIALIASAIRTSDAYGSLVYTEGWLTRRELEDVASLNPAFETQEQLVVIWDRQLKEAIQNLQRGLTDQNQVAARGFDRAYAGNVQQWIKAANAVRLRLASRLWNIQPATARAIAAEVLAPGNAANVFSSIDDSFIFWYEIQAFGGEWHSLPDMTRGASNNFMNYLVRNEDPRKRIFFVENNLTPQFIIDYNIGVIEGRLGSGNPFNMIPMDSERWAGAYVNFDKRGNSMPTAAQAPVLPKREDFASDAAFRTAAINYMTDFDWEKYQEDYKFDRRIFNAGGWMADANPTWPFIANPPQTRLWDGRRSLRGRPGNGGWWFPVITYAEFSFLAAEFVLREGIASSKTAQQWYETGVEASLRQWSDVGRWTDLLDYTLITPAEISTFLNMPDIKWNPAIALEQIYAQSYVEHFKNVDEMWALWKRTGFPNTTSNIITFEPLTFEGATFAVPRRIRFDEPNPGVANYDNLMKRLQDMQKDPKFGALDNEFGRVWWDAPSN
ncbi:MAG: SusD/RagB family nutrient-binding outer membrane lipoprotein [Dysgonamonadaceae bacterium]|jgi:hypothetical protein|nr:SusD/RagB family nutrient-binding outer membrane lipoprotein [Dysgonamonadaceae bacterium]